MTNYEPITPSEGPFSSPSGSPVWVRVVVGLVCLSLGLAVSFWLKTSKPSAGPTVPCASAVSSEQKPKVQPDLIQRATMGETQAMEELSGVAVEQRSVAQAVALAKGRAAQKQTALDLLRENLAQNV